MNLKWKHKISIKMHQSVYTNKKAFFFKLCMLSEHIGTDVRPSWEGAAELDLDQEGTEAKYIKV